MSGRIVVVGAGLAGLSAALTVAEQGFEAALVSLRPSERAQSVMAEGGINAALGWDDDVRNHYDDTLKAGRFLADPNAVRGLTEAAPGILRRLVELGALFNMRDGKPELRYFGGQKIKRTAFARSGTGKQLMSAVIQEVRKYEARGLITRYDRHVFAGLLRDGNGCTGCVVRDTFSGEPLHLRGCVVISTGGMHGIFGCTTGSSDNTGAVTAALFRMGVPVANGEFVQYHPTTVSIPGKRLLISEAARGEGGRLFVLRGGKPYYFMEDKHPEFGNLAPRDVVSREMWALGAEQAYLDMTGLSGSVFRTRLSDTLEDCLEYLRLDPRKEPVPVAPGVHYFMGGIQVDERHRTALPGLYAAGESCCQYHGANRLGGNSLLGAIYGGMRAAESVMSDGRPGNVGAFIPADAEPDASASPAAQNAVRSALGIARDRAGMEAGIAALEELRGDIPLLGRAILAGALLRKESRGAHFRKDYPDENDAAFRKTTVVSYDGRNISVRFENIPERR
ncbi:MAG: FAD-binding protein [Treponema sp.]|jgi:succinate dehydrogenase / fumarate reductase flavoprotein subunit|nr:FAD-binding protein [Treponema sp.]